MARNYNKKLCEVQTQISYGWLVILRSVTGFVWSLHNGDQQAMKLTRTLHCLDGLSLCRMANVLVKTFECTTLVEVFEVQ